MMELRAAYFPNGDIHWTAHLGGHDLHTTIVRDGDGYRAFTGRKRFPSLEKAAAHALGLRIKELQQGAVIVENGRLAIEEGRFCVKPAAEPQP